MEFRTNEISFKSIVLVFLAFLIAPLIIILLKAGLLLTGTAGSNYFGEIIKRHKEAVPVTAVVTDVGRDFGKDKISGYQILEYEYNGKKYTTTQNIYIEYRATVNIGNPKHSSGSQKSDHIYKEERSEENWKELQETVGTAEEIMVDPDDPSDAFILADMIKMGVTKVLAFIGIASLVLAVVLGIILFFIVRKIVRILRNCASGAEYP